MSVHVHRCCTFHYGLISDLSYASLFLYLCHPTLSAKAVCLRSFVRTPDRSCYHNISQMAQAVSMKLTRSIRWHLVIRFWKSKVKDQGHNRPSTWRRRPRRRLGVAVNLVVFFTPPGIAIPPAGLCFAGVTFFF